MQVVTVASRVPKEPYYRYQEFLQSLSRFGVQPVVLGMNQEWRGLMTKPWRLREWLRAGNAAGERIIVCDAFDVLFAAPPEEADAVAQAHYGDLVAFNAERACWPRGDLAEHFPETGTPWRYLNSGVMVGPSERILALLEAMDIERIGFDPPGGPYPNDQGEYQRLYVERPVPMAVDGGCVFSACLSGCVDSDLDETGRLTLTGTRPAILHLNGGAKEVFGDRLVQQLAQDRRA